MAYTLRFVFSGLCMFVPDNRDARNPKMHVLLPDARTHPGHPHSLALFYDECHKEPGQSPTGNLERRQLGDRKLVVPNFGGGADLRLRRQIVNLSEPVLTNQRIAPSQVDNNQPRNMGARITLGSGAIEACDPGVFWKLGTQERCMTHRVVWKIQVPDADDFDLHPGGINGGPGQPNATKLHKTKDDEQVTILVFNAMENDLPPRVPNPTKSSPGHKADHFHHFYHLFPDHVSLGDPELLAHECPAEAEDPSGGVALQVGGGVDPFRCMVAGGTLG